MMIVKTRIKYNCAQLRLTKESLTFEYLETENIFLAEKKKTREGREGKYLKKESIYFAEEKKNGEGKEGGNMYVFFVEEKKNRGRIEENIWRRKIYFLRRSF